MASEVVVSFVVGKLGDLLVEEARLLYDVCDQFEWIVRELKRMQCFLKDADAKQKEDERVRNWVTEIRDVSYDAEDVIDTFILTQTAQASQRTRRRLFLAVKRYICIVSELTTRHMVSKKIQHIKMKISDISSSLHTYGIRDINDGRQERPLNIRRRSYALYEEPDLIGMQESLITLKEQLINEEARRCVISIVGMGGSGKTTLAKKVYHDVKNNFDCHAFIYLSQQYEIRDILIRIIECVMGLSGVEKENSDLSKQLRDHLREKRYLVVIDDIWTMQAWDELKLFLPDGLSKSRVMLTTRNKEVALHADNVINHHYIRLLNEDESWELFHKKIFPKGVVCPLELMETGKKILAKCRGLPLAIVILGGLLSRRDKTFSAWSKVLDGVTWHLAEDSIQCREILALSYYDLPYYLKPCFLYLGLFPEDYEIKSKDLIKLWVAEGFIQQRGDEIMEDVAEDYLEELIGRSMIQLARKRSNGSVSTCRIHDLLRDLSMSEARQVNFFAIYGDNDATSSSSSLRRVALHRNVDEHRIINRSAATLRSMLCFSDPSFHLSRLLNRGGKLLRVFHVDVDDLQINKLPMKIEEEVHLRYLRVYGIRSLPSSVKTLSNLQVIILSNDGGTLPSAIWDLERLRHLYAYNWNIDGRPRLNNFRNLQTLCLNTGSWIEYGLDKLTNLRKLGISGEISSHHKALSDAIEKWCSLRSFKLCNLLSIPPFVSFAHHQNLYKMVLDGRIEKLPKLPSDLAKLVLFGSQLQEEAIETLEKLQTLQVLKLSRGSYCSEKVICSSAEFSRLELLVLDCSNLKELIVEEGGFPCLEYLKLYCCNLNEWIVKEGAFPRLESLEVDCSNLKEWIVEEGALKSLKRIMLGPHDHLKTLPNQVVHLLEKWFKEKHVVSKILPKSTGKHLRPTSSCGDIERTKETFKTNQKL